MRTVILNTILSSAILASGVVRAEGTGIWAAYGYSLPQGTDSRVLTPESRTDPTRALLAWWDGPHSAIVAADAGFGAVSAKAWVSSSSAGSVNHYINSGFADEITLSRPDLAGQPGRITLGFYYEGRMTAFAAQDADVSVSSMWSAYVNDASGSVREDMSVGELDFHVKSTYVNDANGKSQWATPFDDRYLTMTADFVWGEPVLFGYTAWTTGYASGHGGHEAVLTGLWGGIIEASAGGTVVSDYSLSSRTGVDYSHPFAAPVPEPLPVALMAAGLCTLIWRPAARRARTQEKRPRAWTPATGAPPG